MDNVNEELLEKCESCDQIRFTWCDIYGIARTRSVSGSQIRRFIKNGIGFWEGCLMMAPHETVALDIPCGMGNVDIKPQRNTFALLPWATKGKYKIGEFLCEPYITNSENLVAASPRYVLMQQLDKMGQRGLNFLSSSEMEFQLLHKTENKLIENKTITNGIGHARFEDFMYTAEQQLHKAGVDIELQQMEVAGSQLEFTLDPKLGIAGADQTFRFKQGIKEIALNDDMRATFMSLPFAGFGNGTHLNFSVQDMDGHNVFHDAGSQDGLSEFAKHWIAGILAHAKSITALCCPTVNCYRRLFTFGCPGTDHWGIDDRTALLRVQNKGPGSTYIENRLISGAANPYISIASTIAAGMDGVNRKLNCPLPGYNKDTNLKLPSSLAEAMNYLKEDAILCDALGNDFIECFVAAKHSFEIPTFKEWTAKEDQAEKLLKQERNIYLLNF